MAKRKSKAKAKAKPAKKTTKRRKTLSLQGRVERLETAVHASTPLPDYA